MYQLHYDLLESLVHYKNDRYLGSCAFFSFILKLVSWAFA